MITGAVGSIVVAGLLARVRGSIDPPNVALVLMVVVVAGAVVGGRAAGAVGAITAAMSFDFFHTKPYYSLVISSRADIETAALLLFVGLVVGQMTARARVHRHAIAAGRSEIQRIYSLAQLASQGAPMDTVAESAERELVQLLNLESAKFERPPFEGPLDVMERSGVVLPPRQRIVVSRWGQNGFELPWGGVELPVFSRGQQVGRFVLVPVRGVGASLEQRVVAVALADQVGAANDDNGSETASS